MKKLSFTLFLLVSLLSLAHPLKTAITDFIYIKEKNEVRIKINLFEDDFEAQLSAIHNKKIDLDILSRRNNTVISNYILKNFKLQLNSSKQIIKFIRYTVIDDPNNKVISVDFVIKHITINTSDKLTITNTILFDANDRQSNPVRIDQFNNKRCRHLEFDVQHPDNTYIFK